jgi:hypothetical protein
LSAQNVIELGFNVEELSAEKKQVLDLMTDLFQQLEKYDGTKFNPLGNGGIADLKKSLIDGAAAMQEFRDKVENYNKVVTEQSQKQQQTKKTTDELTLATKEYEKIVNTAATTQAKQNAASSTAAENLAIDKEQLRQRNKELADGAKFLVTEANSTGEAKAAVALLTAERDKLNLKTEEGKARQAELNAEINRYNDFIKANVSDLEKQKINIGNYTGSILILKESLQNIGSRLEAMAAAGDIASEAFQKLTLEQKILQALMDRQSQGFANINQELKSTKNALDSLAVAGLEQTETFEKLNQEYTTAKQKVTELHEEQKILTAEEPGFTALAAAARGLGGAYAVGAGASALFASGNEKVEKELNKLVAIMTVLQGLEEAVKAVKDRGAIATALQGQATKLLNFAREVEIALLGESVAATTADTEAATINTEAKAVNAEATEGQAAAAEINTVAMETTAVATEEATAATISFSTALIATGIGAILIATVAAIVALVSAISDWANADEKAIESEKALAEASKELLSIQVKLYEAMDEGDRKLLANLEKKAAADQAAGKNVFINISNENKLSEQRSQNAKKQLAELDLTRGAVEDLNEQRIEKGLTVAAIEGRILDLKRQQASEDDIKDETKKLDAAKAVYEQVNDLYEKGAAAVKTIDDEEKNQDVLRIQAQKAAFDILEKVTLDDANRRYQISKDANDRILNDDRSTEAQRMSAIRGNLIAEQNLAGTQIADVQRRIDAEVITEQEGANEIANIQNGLTLKQKQAREDRLKVIREYNERELVAQTSIRKNRNESDADVQSAITKDVQKELGERLEALKRNIDDRTKVIVDDFNTQIKLAKDHGKTDAEITAIETERQKALVALTADVQKQIYDITISYGERRLKAVQDLNKLENSTNHVTANYNRETFLLNQALIDRNISYNRYLKDKEKLDREYNIEKDRAAIKDDETALDNLREFLQKELNLKLFFAEKELESAKKGGDDKEIANAQAKVNALNDVKKKAAADDVALTDKLNKDKGALNNDLVSDTLKGQKILAERIKEVEKQSFELAKTLVDASFENRINKIQQEIDLNDKRASAEIDAIQRSTLSQQDKEAELIIIQANQKARDTQLHNEQKQEKIKEAKFDRDVALAQVAWDTAKAVMKDTAGVPWPLSLAIAAADITLGAIQAATILARPIPTYGDGIGIPGKGRHPGGPALTGERNEPELVTIPGQQPFIVDKPTLLDLPADSSVLPLRAQDIVHDLGWAGLIQGAAMINGRQDNSNPVVEAINAQTVAMKRAYTKSQRNIQNIVNVHVDGEWNNYVNKKIIGKA